MRKARIVAETAAYYHVVSRVVGRARLFDTAEERERFTKTMRQVEGFSGVQILAFTARQPSANATALADGGGNLQVQLLSC